MFKLRRGHALRLGRVDAEGQVYIVTTVTRDRRRHFADFAAGCVMSRAITQPALWPEAVLLAWVLMPDHMHLLVQLGPRDGLAGLMKRLKSATSYRFRVTTGISAIWQHGFHDHALRRDEGVREAGRYIIANPVRAGLVSRVGDYPFWDAVWLDPSANPLDP